MTRKQALRFRERVAGGERPPLPVWVRRTLALPVHEIARSVRRAYGHSTSAPTAIVRLMEMGLMAEDYQPTLVGKEYLFHMKPTDPGVYIYQRTVVYLERTSDGTLLVFNVLGKNDYMGTLAQLDNDGWGQKLDVDYDP